MSTETATTAIRLRPSTVIALKRIAERDHLTLDSAVWMLIRQHTDQQVAALAVTLNNRRSPSGEGGK